eukprot:2051560-Amphidinium_carterae.1
MEGHWVSPRNLADHSSLTEHTLFSIVSGLRMGGPPGLALRGLKRTISVLRIGLGDFSVSRLDALGTLFSIVSAPGGLALRGLKRKYFQH